MGSYFSKQIGDAVVVNDSNKSDKYMKSLSHHCYISNNWICYNRETQRDVNPPRYWAPLHYQILLEMAMVVQVSYKLGMYRISIRYPVSAGYLTIRYYPDTVK